MAMSFSNTKRMRASKSCCNRDAHRQEDDHGSATTEK